MDTTQIQQPLVSSDITLIAQTLVEAPEISVSVAEEPRPMPTVDEVELAASVALPASQTSSPASSPSLGPVEGAKLERIESGYASDASEDGLTPTTSTAPPPRVHLTKPHINYLNAQLEHMTPQEILRFSKILFPNLYQSTGFGLTGLATLDMLDKIQKESPSLPHVDLIFLDTLYHFQETYDLVNRVRERHPNQTLHVFKPWNVDTATDFEATYGERLWEEVPDMYDYTVKVEPLQRAYEELGVSAVITGRRRSQGGARDTIPVIELDEERGVVKINPMVGWSFAQVREYIRENGVPYNALLDQGFKSVGDWHSTSPVGEGEDERAGRWKGQAKTECGIHNKKSRYAQFLEKEREKEQEQKLESLSAQLMAESGPAQAIQVG